MITVTVLSSLPVESSKAERNIPGAAISLADVESLDAAVLSKVVRAHGRLSRRGETLRLVDVSPGVGRTLSQLGLAWMLTRIPAANEPMRHAA